MNRLTKLSSGSAIMSPFRETKTSFHQPMSSVYQTVSLSPSPSNSSKLPSFYGLPSFSQESTFTVRTEL